MDVILVNMPMVGVARPSIALGILKSQLVNQGVDTYVVNAHLRFAQTIGLEEYIFITRYYQAMLGEWIFATAAFGESELHFDGYVEWFEGFLSDRGEHHSCLKSRLKNLITAASKFITDIASEIVDANPKIVGCTSVFQQHIASIALLKHIKGKSPGIITMMGGANCESIMGKATLDVAPWLDYVVSGEADELIAPMCKDLLRYRKLGENVKSYSGILKASEKGLITTDSATVARATCQNLDAIAAPDYDEYFHDLDCSQLKSYITPAILLESSRGCWWGQTSHCKFCGLNGESMAFREKNEALVVDEIRALTSKYNSRRIGYVDNIMSYKSVKRLLPLIRSLDSNLELFYETITNLKREEVSSLRAAGVLCIQPGIESLSSSVLELVGKGNSALQGIEVLKWCNEFGVEVRWGYLYGFSGEKDHWYYDMLEWLPAIFHLQPPLDLFPVEYHRFSPYFNDASKFGLVLIPAEPYKYIYPFRDELNSRLAFLFKDESNKVPTTYIPAMKNGIAQWKNAFSFSEQKLSMREVDGVIEIQDNRIENRAIEIRLNSIESHIYKYCDTGKSEKKVIEVVMNYFNYTKCEVTSVLDRLVEKRLVLRIDNKLLSLAVRERRFTYPYEGAYAPYGKVSLQK